VLDTTNAHVGVYQVLDEVLAGTAVPPGAKGAMFAIIDQLRSQAGAGDDLRRAEQVSIGLHKLELALRQSDEAASQGARDDLKSLAAAWIQTRIDSRH
jgi:hypothetical protein